MTPGRYSSFREQERKRERRDCPSQTPAAKRKQKLKSRYKDNLDTEIARTQEKLAMLLDIKAELNQ